MSKPIQVGDASSLESLDVAYKASQERHDRERLLAIRLAHEGRQTLEQIGSILKRVKPHLHYRPYFHPDNYICSF